MATTKPSMRFIVTTAAKLDSIEKIAGQLVFVKDTRAIYLDISPTERTTYECIITVANDETRKNLPSPIQGFYYVKLENTLWGYFNNTWVQISGNNSSIVFSDEGLPEEGEANVVYVYNTQMYRWNTTTNSYNLISGGTDWEVMTNN